MTRWFAKSSLTITEQIAHLRASGIRLHLEEYR